MEKEVPLPRSSSQRWELYTKQGKKMDSPKTEISSYTPLITYEGETPIVNFSEILSFIPQEKYGVSEARSVEQLHQEFLSGESAFFWEEDYIVRRLWVLRARVKVMDFTSFHPQEKFLKEVRQIMPDGRVRQRDHDYWSLGEKLLPTEVEVLKKNENEKNDMVLIRAVKEELSLSYPESFYPDLSICFGIEKEVGFSKSYPGIETEYFFQSWRIFMRPEYYSAQYVEYCDDGTKTFFEWERPRGVV